MIKKANKKAFAELETKLRDDFEKFTEINLLKFREFTTKNHNNLKPLIFDCLFHKRCRKFYLIFLPAFCSDNPHPSPPPKMRRNWSTLFSFLQYAKLSKNS